MMSKKDYQAIAQAIYRQRELRMACAPVQDALAGLAEELSAVLAADNPRFNRALFMEACETGQCKGMRG